MDTIRALLSRRTIRRYCQEEIVSEDIGDIVKAGAMASSAGNRQPWRFIAVTERLTVEAVTDTLVWLEGEPGAGERPVAHVVVLIPKGSPWAVEADAAAAIQNMLLAAWDKGIGGCWFGSINREEMAALLDIPEKWHIYSSVSLGYPAEKPRLVESLETRVRRSEDGVLTVPKLPLDAYLDFNGFSG